MDKLLIVEEVARAKNVSRTTVRDWISQHRLPAEKVGWRWMVKESDLAKFEKAEGRGWVMVNDEDDRTVSPRQIAHAFSVSYETARHWLEIGQVPGEKINGRWVAKQSAVEAQGVEFDNRPNPIADIARQRQLQAEVEFKVCEIRRQHAAAESDKRVLTDQNLRLRCVLTEQVRFLQEILGGYELSHGQAQRQLSMLQGAIEYRGRDMGPLDYKPRETGGALGEAWEHAGESRPSTVPSLLDQIDKFEEAREPRKDVGDGRIRMINEARVGHNSGCKEN